MPGFKDHFSAASEDYQRYRPSYPRELFEYLSSQSNKQERAWDCATGTGQSALALTDYFSEVIATDASKSQIGGALAHKKITYKVAMAEKSGLAAESIDLVTVAQALHWFNLPAFSVEVERVLRNDGMLAIWSYRLFRINPALDEIVDHLYRNILQPYWPAERKRVDDGYRDVEFPFVEIPAAKFRLQQEWNLQQLLGYLATWSAVRRCDTETGKNPLENIQPELSAAWGQADKKLVVEWPLDFRLWKK